MIKPKITKEEVNSLPIKAFEGKITVVDTSEKANDALKVLNKQKFVGIDTETKPSFKRGQLHKVSLLQLATMDHCFLFRLNVISFPEELGDFLSNRHIRKIGLALKDDFVGLNKRHPFKPENIIDLQLIVKNYGILELGLQKIFALVFSQKISKSQRLSNWETPELSVQQQRYAATDAWAPLMIYLELKKRKKLTRKELEQFISEHTASE